MDERRYFRERVEPLLGDGVHYVGEVGHHDKVRLLAGAAALLNPIAWSEPFGLAMVESLACGTPVVATGVGSVPEIVEDGVTGFVCGTDTVPDGEARDDGSPRPDEATRRHEMLMAARLLQVDRIDRGACRRAAQTRFSTQRMVADHLALYERILAANAGQGGRLAGEAA